MASDSWWFRILLIATMSAFFVFGRHIDDVATESVNKQEREVVNFSHMDIERMVVWLEQRLLEENNEEKELMELARVEREESNEDAMMADERNGKLREEFDRDYLTDSIDYMGDGPENPVLETNKDKVMDLMGNANGSSHFAQTNGSLEDPANVKEQRERSKELRLSSIRSTILELRKGNVSAVNGSFPSTRTLQEMFELNRDFQPHISATSYTEKMQSFYPSCKTPNHTDEEIWSDSNLMNILFNVTFPTPSVGTAIQVMGSKLRLYKKRLTNVTSSPVEASGGASRSTRVDKAGGFTMQGNSESVDDERLLRVSVYWYTRALKKNRVKRKLLDSQMFTLRGDQAWIELNIRIAVRYWRENGRNFGLLVTVEDEDGAILPANRYLHAMNCSKDAASVKPLPSFVEDAAKQYIQQHPETNQSSFTQGGAVAGELNPFPDFHYPKLDICSIEVPVTEHRQIPETSCLLKKSPEQIPNDLFKLRNDTTAGPIVSKRQGNETRATFFNMVGLGSPSSGPNRNALVPILTKSDVVTAPEDDRMRSELNRLQTEAPRLRHRRKHTLNFRNETN